MSYRIIVAIPDDVGCELLVDGKSYSIRDVSFTFEIQNLVLSVSAQPQLCIPTNFRILQIKLQRGGKPTLLELEGGTPIGSHGQYLKMKLADPKDARKFLEPLKSLVIRLDDKLPKK
jgi:hypothetical protein